MPSVGTAYVNVRVNTKGFEAGLDSALKKLTGKMEVAGRQLGRSMTSELRSTNWDDGFKGLPEAAGKASTRAANSIKKVQEKVLDLAISGNDAGNNIKRGLDAADRSAKNLSGSLSEVKREGRGAERSVKGIGGGGGGGGLRSAGDSAGFFSGKLREVIDEAGRGRQILDGLFQLAAFGGTAMAGLAGGLSAAAQGVFAIGANAAAAAPAVAVLTNGMIGLAQVGGVIGIAMSGVGGALTAGFDAAEKGAVGATSAIGGMGEATAAASRAVRDAKQALQDAYEDAADAAADAARQTADAERALAEAQQETAAAQRELNLAREEALEQIEDIMFAAEDAALAEDRAALALIDARQELRATADLAPNDRVRVEAELAFQEAELNYRMAKDRRQDTVRDQQEVAKKGVEATDAMRDARGNLADAEENEADAARALADARRNEAEVAEDNAESIADAQQALADAQRDLTQAQKQGTEAMQAAATAADEYQSALDDLGPNQQEFVKRIIAMKERFKELRNFIVEPLFGKLNTSLDILNQKGKDNKDIFDTVAEGLRGTGEVLGDVAIDASKLAASDAFQERLGNIMESNNDAMENFGDAGVDLADAFTKVAEAAGPLLRRFSRWVEDVGEMINTSDTLNKTIRVTDKERITPLTQTINRAGDRIAEFWGFAKQLWRTLMILGGAANEAANKFGDMGRESEKARNKFGYIQTLTRNMKEFNRNLEKNPDLIDNFTQSLKSLNAVGRAFKNVIVDPLITLGQDPNVEKAFDILAESDAFNKLAASAGDALPSLANLIVELAELFAILSESGAIKVFLDVLTFVADAAGDFAQKLSDMGILKYVALFTGFATALRLLWTVFKIVISPVVLLFKALKFLFRPILFLINKFGLWRVLLRVLGGAFRVLLGPVGWILLAFEILWPLLVKLEEKTGIFSKAWDLLTDAFHWLWDILKVVWAWIEVNAPKVWDWIKDAFDKIRDKFNEVSDKVSEMKEKIKKRWDQIVDFVQNLPDRVKKALSDLWDAVKDRLSDAWAWVRRTWNRIVAWVGGRPEVFKKKLAELWDALKDKLSDAWDWVVRTWNRIITWLGDRPEQFARTLKALWEIVKDKLAEAWQWVQDKWERIKNEVAGWPDAIGRKLAGLWDSLGDGLASALNWVGGKLNWLIGELNNLLGKFNIGEIGFKFKTNYAFAEGGPVTGPGGPKSDRILAALSNGEYVMPTAASRKIGRSNLDYMRKTGELPGGTGGIIGWVADKYNSLADALKEGAATAFKWVLSKFKDTIGGSDNLLAQAALGVLDWAADKIVDVGEREDRQAAARKRRRQAQQGAAYNGPSGGWTYPISRHVPVSQWPNSGHSPPNSIDFDGVTGDAIRSASRGTVAYVNRWSYSYGNHVVVNHAGGISTLYAHLASIAVRAGQSVRTGHTLGMMGTTGNSTGVHLHFEVRGDGLSDDWLRKHGVRLAHGGVVAPSSAGTLALIAEAGKHERVTPLDNEGFTPAERQMLAVLEDQLTGSGGGDQYHVHPAAGMDETALADLVVRRVAWRRRRGRGWR